MIEARENPATMSELSKWDIWEGHKFLGVLFIGPAGMAMMWNNNEVTSESGKFDLNSAMEIVKGAKDVYWN